MDRLQRLRRYGLFTAGVAVSAGGIAFITRAALGTSPLSSLPFVLSLITPPSVGVYTFAFNLLFLAAEAVLRRTFTRMQALQIPFTLLFSVSIDLFMWLIPTQLHGPYPMKVLYLLIGCGLLGLGVTLEVLGDVIMLPGEALVRAISQKSHVPFHRVKVLFDSTLTLIAAVAALLASGRLNGVKEGTLVAALAVGPLVNVYTQCLGPSLRRWLDAPAV